MSLLFCTHPDAFVKAEEIKIVYDKWRNRKFGQRLPVHIFGTGSDGNSVYLKPQHTLIDLGLPFKRYVDYDPYFFLNVDYIMLTHHHGDHLNPSTLFRILKDFPHIKIIIPEAMWVYVTGDQYKTNYKRQVDTFGNQLYFSNAMGQPIKNKPLYCLDENGQKIIESLPWQDKFLQNEHRFLFSKPMMLQTHNNTSFLYHPRTTKHGDISNIAIQIYDETYDLRLLYASDLDNLGGPSGFMNYRNEHQAVDGLDWNLRYNIAFVEANYDEAILEAWVNEKLSAIDSAPLLDHIKEKERRNIRARSDGNLRHISEQETFQFIQQTLDDNGLFIPLHASSTFGTLIQ